MISALVNRLLLSIPVLIGVVIFGFLLIKMAPGDPAQIMAGPTATPEVVAQIRQQMGLDQPLIVQLGRYAERLMQGDLGRSLISNRPVLSELAAAVGPTVELMIASLQAEDPEAQVLPFMLGGGTDNKSLSRLGITGYGFAPMRLPADLAFTSLFHGIDERVPVDALEFGCRVLERMLEPR